MFYFFYFNSSCVFVCLRAFRRERKRKGWNWVGGELCSIWKELLEGKPCEKINIFSIK